MIMQRDEVGTKVRVAIDCRIPEARQGHGAAIRGLAHGLSGLSAEEAGGQEYTFVVTEELREWLEPYVGGACRLAVVGRGGSGGGWKRWGVVRWAAGWVPRGIPEVPVSDGYVEGEGFDVVHFPTQQAYLTRVPSVYQPWDLQHVHYPEFFSARDLVIRDRWYRAFCAQASVVCVQAEWTRRDVVASYGVAAEKVMVVPWGSTFAAYRVPGAEVVEATRARYGVAGEFFVYPAVTWPHKNHAVVLRALAVLRARHGRRVEVYLTGAATVFRGRLEAMARELGVAEQVHWLGFVSTDELQSLFRMATGMVFPSLFEGFGLPILEAFHAGLPVIASTATVLPEVAQEGALYFDAGSEEDLAEAMLRVLDEPGLREAMRARGSAVLGRFDLGVTARGLRAVYRQVAEGGTQVAKRGMQVAGGAQGVGGGAEGREGSGKSGLPR